MSNEKPVFLRQNVRFKLFKARRGLFGVQRPGASGCLCRFLLAARKQPVIMSICSLILVSLLARRHAATSASGWLVLGLLVPAGLQPDLTQAYPIPIIATRLATGRGRRPLPLLVA